MNEIIRMLREKNNYSQNSIATFLGISRQMYIKYEQGVIVPPVKVVKDLANFYRVPYEYIIDGKSGLTVDSDKTRTYSFEGVRQELELNDPAGTFALPGGNDCLERIVDLLPKLEYGELLQLLSKLCDMVKGQSVEKKIPSKKMQAFQRVLNLNNELHLKSDGKGWSREELHERN